MITRRRLLAAAGSSLALSTLPLAARLLRAGDASAKRLGGPTPNQQFYVTSYDRTPNVDAGSWRLQINGLVKRPLSLSYAEIRKLPAIKETLTLECISNPPDGSSISNAEWLGTRLTPLLDEAGLRGKAAYAAMRAADGYYTGVPVEELKRKENFLVYLMNGVPLPPAHGYPLRIFIPGKYGMKQPKWLTEITFVDHEFTGYWEARGWSNSAWRKVNSGFFQPKPADSFLFARATRVTAPIDIFGWALAGPSGIRRVEVSFDDGKSWQSAELLENNSPYIWTVWKYHWAPAGPGSYRMRVRATSGDGVMQPRSDPQRGSGMSGQPFQDFTVS